MGALKFVFLFGLVMALQAIAASVISHDENSEGVPTSIDKFLSAVSITIGSSNICSGVIINNHWILTTANCITNYTNSEDLQILYGSQDRKSVRNSVDVDQIVIHPQFNQVSLVNNIALIKTKENIVFGANVHPATLPVNNSEEGDQVYAVGWEINDKHKRQDSLKSYEVSVMALDLCWERVEDVEELGNIQIPDNVICTYGPTDKTLPPLDNGSALFSVEDYKLVGIASVYQKSHPKIYTRLFSFIQWIEHHINK